MDHCTTTKQQTNNTIPLYRRVWSLVLSYTPLSIIKNLWEVAIGKDPLTWRKLNTKEKIRKTSASIVGIAWWVRVSMMMYEQEHSMDPTIEFALWQILGFWTQTVGVYHSGELGTIIQTHKQSLKDNIHRIKTTGGKINTHAKNTVTKTKKRIQHIVYPHTSE